MPRRQRSGSNVSVKPSHVERTQSPAITQQPKRLLDMSPAIYENNMKVLHRREPSITSIFDQFSHVCLYHHNGRKWEKQGYEGSMFLFEKQTYPPYGFFILNRMGTDDYICPIHPEDDMEIVGDYVMYRSYPEYTKKRLELGLSYPIPEEHRAQFDAELLRSQPAAESDATNASTDKKGISVTIGLWMFATDAREPLKDVMMRLHSYIKQGKPYPAEFRYGPGHPPPPNPHLRTASRASVSSMTQEISLPNEKQAQEPQGSGPPTTGSQPSSAGSDLDKLFAKLIPSASATPAIEAQVVKPPTTAGMTVQDLFTTLGGPTQSQARAPSIPLVAPAPTVVSQTTAAPQTRGLALLDSIFASATPSALPAPALSNIHTAPPLFLPPHPEDIHIVSPKPTSSALPQILNQDVISTLLGLGPGSRASSTAPSSAGSRRSAPNRYEGDNEDSEGEAASEASSTHPVFAVQQPIPSLTNFNQGRKTPRRIEGDVTPRAIVRGIGPVSPSPPAQTSPIRSEQCLIPHPAAGLRPDSSSVSTSTLPFSDSAAVQRKLVPFEADSDLWPYPRAPLDDRSVEEADVDVVELDFNDTRALSDPSLFSSRLKEKQGKAGAKKKSRKERAAEREKEREEIEKGWDDPVRGQVQSNAVSDAAVQPATPVVNGKAKQAAVNGTSVAKPVAGGGLRNDVHTTAVKAAIVSAMNSQANIPSTISRNDFVRELLTLIHTDKNFVDNLWQEYLTRTC